MGVKLFIIICVGVAQAFKYPEIRRDDTVDDYFGTKIADPYRWLEDLDSNETLKFVKDQNNLTLGYIQEAPSRNQIRETLTKLWTYPREGLPNQRGDFYFLMKNSGLQNQRILYKGKTLQEVYKDDAQVFLDPNELAKDGTISLKRTQFSRDGSLMVYTLSKSGSDWTTIHVKDAKTGKDLKEVLNYSKFTSISWTHDNLGFFYTRYNTTMKDGKLGDVVNEEFIYYHKIGTSQEEDVLSIRFPDRPDWSISMDVSDEGDYLYISCYKVTNEDYGFYAILKGNDLTKELKTIPLITNPASYSLIANDGPIFYFITNEGAPNYRIIGMDINTPDKEHWSTLIPEHEKHVLSWAAAIDEDKLLVSYNRDVKSSLELRNLRNGTLIIEYPLEAGSIDSTQGRRVTSQFYFKLVTFTNPGVIYKLDFANGSIPRVPELYRKTAFKGLDTNLFETKQVFYQSKDNTTVPMFIVKRKDLVLKGDAPTIIYGYGGFTASIEPFFSVSKLAFVNMFNGIFAVANIRGGNEYGTKWWHGGRLFKKQNVFDDFASAAEYLIKENYTNTGKLAIEGASNGGLLVSACLNQRPELYGAGLAQVGVMDMLRFQKFTVGAFWCGEYGCSDNETHFNNLIKYSPLHNIKSNTTYPAVLVQTADHDDRVVPSHSFKYIAQLQHIVGSYVNQTQPLMIRVEEKAGHGSGKPTWKVIEELVDIYSFLQRALGYQFINN